MIYINKLYKDNKIEVWNTAMLLN